jgi:hypothetical protein
MPKFALHINPHTRKAYIKPPSLKPAPTFPGRGVLKKTYRRKRNLRPYTGMGQVVYSPAFANKQIEYVAIFIGHGSSLDISSVRGDRIEEYPLFKTNYDLVFVTPHGSVVTTHGIPQSVHSHLCNMINARRTQPTQPFTGVQLMDALQSTIRSDQEQRVAGQLVKTTILKQRNAGSNVPNLDMFRAGYTKNLDRIDGIYLFKVGHPCDPSHNHNVLTVNPTRLVKTHPELWYVAQTATYLQSFIEPTETHGKVVGTSRNDTEFLFNTQYQLKRDKTPVRLSDVLGQTGIFPFPDNTAVIAYVCRGIGSLLPSKQPYDSPGTSDYTTATSSASSSMSPGDAAASAAVADDADDAAFSGWGSNPLSDDDALSWDGSIGSDAGGSMKKRAKFKKTLKKRRN